MSISKALTFAGLMLASLAAGAAQPVIDLGAGDKLIPGVYGEVKPGKNIPPLVYPDPKSIVIYTVPRKLEPIYLHVPPEQAQHWDQYCREYKACDRPTYFVKSREYEPGYVPPKGKNKAGKKIAAQAGQGKHGNSSRNGSGDGSGDGTGRHKGNNNGGGGGGGKGDGSGGGHGKQQSMNNGNSRNGSGDGSGNGTGRNKNNQ